MDTVIKNDKSGWVTDEIFMDMVMETVEENYIENGIFWLRAKRSERQRASGASFT